MTDILERIENWKHHEQHADLILADCAKEIERLREALQAIRDEIVYGGGDVIEGPDIDKLHDLARAALQGQKP